MKMVQKVASKMQTVLTTEANQLAEKHQLIVRQRKFTGETLAQTLVLGWLADGDATLEDLAQTAAALNVEISPQALDQRLTNKTSDFLFDLLLTSVDQVIAAQPVAIEILARFNGVYLIDSSVIRLPDELAEVWVGCSGSSQLNTSSSVKLQVGVELATGLLIGPQLCDGRSQDKSSTLQVKPLPAESLRIADLGYYSFDRMNQIGESGYWLTRLPCSSVFFDALGKKWQLVSFLKNQPADRHTVEMKVQLGKNAAVSCRLMAVRVPKKVAAERRRKIRAKAKQKGKTPSQRRLEMADWTVLATNAPQPLLTLDEAFVLLRVRWQIELLFKLWKSEGKIDESKSQKPYRILCELYAKLIAMIIQHWILICCCWQYPNRSLFKAVKTVRRHAMSLVAGFARFSLSRIIEAIQTMGQSLTVAAKINKRNKEPHTYQLLLDLSLSSM